MKPEEIAAIKALADAATPEPWRVTIEAYGDEWWFGGTDEGQAIIKMGDEDEVAVMGLFRSEPNPRREASAAFIAAARAAVPRLIKHIEELETIIARLSNIPR